MPMESRGPNERCGVHTPIGAGSFAGACDVLFASITYNHSDITIVHAILLAAGDSGIYEHFEHNLAFELEVLSNATFRTYG